MVELTTLEQSRAQQLQILVVTFEHHVDTLSVLRSNYTRHIHVIQDHSLAVCLVDHVVRVIDLGSDDGVCLVEGDYFSLSSNGGLLATENQAVREKGVPSVGYSEVGGHLSANLGRIISGRWSSVSMIECI